mmetsp:Transcript_27025/g.76032  ORF Transcript_27025/g.76032 Transcript_27025/m.76032 type:complete len:284 (+) Transcript_27025:238-1089(+)
MTTEETINPDGTFESDAGGTFQDEQPQDDSTFTTEEEILPQTTDPAIYLLIAAIFISFMYYLYYRQSKQSNNDDDFFANLDGEKFNLKLPAAVAEYEDVKEKCIAAGWVAGKPPTDKSAAGPHRVLAQALMKRSIADIPLVTHIQKESAGMNKLYANSMCSVNQWKSYQAAEAMISAEVDDVRAEADEIEPGWSQVIWRQAMQYHNMLKQKNEAEQKAAAEAAAKRKEIEAKVNSIKAKEQAEEDKFAKAERLAKELIEQEEREKQSKKAFSSGGGMKKGFLK